MAKKQDRKFLNLMEVLKAVDVRQFQYYDQLVKTDEDKLYSPYMIMRYASSTSHQNKIIQDIIQEHYIETVNKRVNTHLWVLSNKHKKLCWLLTASCGIRTKEIEEEFIRIAGSRDKEARIYHPWIKPMKKVANKSLQKLMDIYPNLKMSDLETLDKIITDAELEQLIEDHGKQS